MPLRRVGDGGASIYVVREVSTVLNICNSNYSFVLLRCPNIPILAGRWGQRRQTSHSARDRAGGLPPGPGGGLEHLEAVRASDAARNRRAGLPAGLPPAAPPTTRQGHHVLSRDGQGTTTTTTTTAGPGSLLHHLHKRILGAPQPEHFCGLFVSELLSSWAMTSLRSSALSADPDFHINCVAERASHWDFFWCMLSAKLVKLIQVNMSPASSSENVFQTVRKTLSSFGQ